jgi:hypothetical protein
VCSIETAPSWRQKSPSAGSGAPVKPGTWVPTESPHFSIHTDPQGVSSAGQGDGLDLGSALASYAGGLTVSADCPHSDMASASFTNDFLHSGSSEDWVGKGTEAWEISVGMVEEAARSGLQMCVCSTVFKNKLCQ